MRRFEFREGSSSKFWESDVEGSVHTVRFGAIGSDGQVKKKSFASPAAAKAEAEKLIKEKTKKGYVEVGDSAPGGAPASGLAAKLGAISDLATQEELDAFGAVLEELEGAPKEDPALLAALLGVLERSQGQDDFGLFATAECHIDEFPTEVRAEGLRQSIRRAVSWKALELIGNSPEDLAALKHALKHQELGALEDEVREKLGDAAEVEEEEADAAPAVAPAKAPAQVGFKVRDHGQGLTLDDLSEPVMRAAHAAAPDAITVTVSAPERLDPATVKRLFECFPPLALEKSHPWYTFFTGPDFDVGSAELAVDALLEPRRDRGVSVNREKNQVTLNYAPVTALRIAAAKRRFPGAARVEFSTEELDSRTAKALAEAFPRAELYADGVLDLELAAMLSKQLAGMRCEPASLGKLPKLPKLKSLRVETAYDVDVTKKAAGQLSKLAACTELEVLELYNGIAGGLSQLTTLPLKELKISRAGDAVLDQKTLEAIAAFKSLRELWIHAPVEPAAWAALGRASQQIELIACGEGGDKSFAAFGKLKQLKKLWSGGNTVSDAGVAALEGLPLEELKLCGKKVTDASLNVLAGMKALRELGFEAASITDKTLAALLPKLPALTQLEVENCKALGDESFAAALKLPKVQQLNWKAPVGKKGIAALASAPASLTWVVLGGKLDAAAFDALLTYRKNGGKVPMRCSELSSKQQKLLAPFEED